MVYTSKERNAHSVTIPEGIGDITNYDSCIDDFYKNHAGSKYKSMVAFRNIEDSVVNPFNATVSSLNVSNLYPTFENASKFSLTLEYKVDRSGILETNFGNYSAFDFFLAGIKNLERCTLTTWTDQGSIGGQYYILRSYDTRNDSNGAFVTLEDYNREGRATFFVTQNTKITVYWEYTLTNNNDHTSSAKINKSDRDWFLSGDYQTRCQVSQVLHYYEP